MAQRDAVWKQCSDGESPQEHAMRDHCWNCAPWWENVPTCPDDGSKLQQSGYCRKCRHYYRLDGPTGSVLSG